VPKSLYGRKPNEKQDPNVHQEDQRAREVQRKKCKGKQSAAEYNFTAEYSSLTKWLRQIKTNWVQDPFNPVNIIWPTKAKIFFYKKTDVKTNMKKHSEKKQGTTRSVNNSNCMKKRKVKPKEMTNTAGNA